MTWPTRFSGALSATALMVAVAASPAGAEITFTGAAGVELGMSESEVRDKLGRPSSSRTIDQGATLLDYSRRKLDVLLSEDRVVRVRTSSRSQTTSAGLGPGDREGTLRRKLRGEQCSTARGVRVCWVRRGPAVKSFRLRRGRVALVEVASIAG